jgi:hypothetical protein
MATKWRLSDIPQLKAMIAAMWSTGNEAMSDEQLAELNLTAIEGQALVYAAVLKLEMKEKTPTGTVLPILGAAYNGEITEDRCKAICILAHAMIVDKETKKNFKAWHRAYTIMKKKMR